MSFRPCPACGGARLKPEVLAVTLGGRNIYEFTRLSVTSALAFLEGLELSATEELIAARIIKEIRERLSFLDNVGVGYLALDRASATLSGGEAQRLRLATQIGSQLVGVLYILDEPSIGLHQRDNDRLIGTLEALRDLGNTVLVVEHDEQMMRSSDWLVDMGPGAGAHGGHVIAEGPASKVERNRKSVTGAFLCGTREIAVPPRRGSPTTAWFGRARGRHAAQPEVDRRRLPDRPLHRGHRRLGLGEVDARQRDRLQVARQPSLEAADQAGRAQERRGDRGLRQGDRDRPAPDRAHPTLEPRHLHRPVHPYPRAVLADPRRQGARLQAGALLLQRQGRALRDLQGRRADQDRDARLPDVYVPCETLQGPAIPTTARRSRCASRARRSPTCSRSSRSRRRSASSRRSRQDPPPPAEPSTTSGSTT